MELIRIGGGGAIDSNFKFFSDMTHGI